MPTESIKKNIIIDDESSAEAFVEALEKAAAIATEVTLQSCNVKELKGSDNIKAFLGDKI